MKLKSDISYISLKKKLFKNIKNMRSYEIKINTFMNLSVSFIIPFKMVTNLEKIIWKVSDSIGTLCSKQNQIFLIIYFLDRVRFETGLCISIISLSSTLFGY
ncbi:hypothetical protein BpHYR1_022571 [Brachionus plicatilis]|uniref:Uncharacterized protein n=1 Tax=Brachionus plicatilis TaxID=10195 RepID=A0A3M7QHW6_BRAPC|nr:hypothetical protein BpHYR1_022571 [Brachionus plicatilis]